MRARPGAIAVFGAGFHPGPMRERNQETIEPSPHFQASRKAGSACPAFSSNSRRTLPGPQRALSLPARDTECWYGTMESAFPCCRKTGGAKPAYEGLGICQPDQFRSSEIVVPISRDSGESAFAMILWSKAIAGQVPVHHQEIGRAIPGNHCLQGRGNTRIPSLIRVVQEGKAQPSGASFIIAGSEAPKRR
jgi:hypothetical protein